MPLKPAPALEFGVPSRDREAALVLLEKLKAEAGVTASVGPRF
jgi:hypothetical protein